MEASPDRSPQLSPHEGDNVVPLYSWDEIPRWQDMEDRLFLKKYENRAAVIEQLPEARDVYERLSEDPEAPIETAYLHEVLHKVAEHKLGVRTEATTIHPKSGLELQISRDHDGLLIQYARPRSFQEDGRVVEGKVGYIGRPETGTGDLEFHNRTIGLEQTGFGDDSGPSAILTDNGIAKREDMVSIFMTLIESGVRPERPDES